MHVFFSGIGGAGIGPLARIAINLGYSVSGSDMAESAYLDSLRDLGATINSGQDGSQIERINKEQPIDWYVYASALKMRSPNHPELQFVSKNKIKNSKRDKFLNHLLVKSQLKLLAVAGTHGKTTTTAMCIWLMKELGVNPSWSVGGKLPFGEMGHADKSSEWFIYECDEFDRNFLSFSPEVSVISGMAYDHHEIYPSLENYNAAFAQFIDQSDAVFAWPEDSQKIYSSEANAPGHVKSPLIDPSNITLAGQVNRMDAAIASYAVVQITGESEERVLEIINKFPGVSRRFEYLQENLVTDYAHTPEKIAGCLQLAEETGKSVVVVYEPLTDRRQHFVKDEYTDLFESVDHLYWVPAFQAREHKNFRAITPDEFIAGLNNKTAAEAAELNPSLKQKIQNHLNAGQLVVCMTGGGKDSLDDWLRKNF